MSWYSNDIFNPVSNEQQSSSYIWSTYAPSAVEMYLVLWVKIVDGSKLIEQETNRIWHF